MSERKNWRQLIPLVMDKDWLMCHRMTSDMIDEIESLRAKIDAIRAISPLSLRIELGKDILEWHSVVARSEIMKITGDA